MNSPINVNYEKIYTDDVGKILLNFNKSNISVKCMWEGAIDAFFQYSFTNKFICLHGDVRIVIAYEDNNQYKFNQYFISGMDGKIITIDPEIWFGIHNLRETKAILLNHAPSTKQVDEKYLSSKIFNWHLKR